MPDGSRPYFPPDLLARLAVLTWSPVRADLGQLTDTSGQGFALYLDAGERWGLYPASAIDLGPFLISKETLDVMRSGKPEALESLRPVFDGAGLVVRGEAGR